MQEYRITDQEIEEVVETYADIIYRIAYTKTKNETDAKDIVQEVFLKYMTKRPEFHDEEHRKAWLLKVTINTSISLLRSSWFQKTTKLEHTMVDRQEEERGLYQMILELPKKERTMIHLHYYEGYSMREIATILEMKESAVKTRIHRIRKKLKMICEEENVYVR